MTGGPLTGLKIVEFAGLGPGPFGAMLLADLGATVLRIERKAPDGLGVARPRDVNFVLRNRNVVELDLKNGADLDLALSLVAGADALIEGFRPGVMERLTLGPDRCLASNPRLVYGRMTGWGQTGPLAQRAGHDLNYIAVAGVLSLIGRNDDLPAPPLNVLGDFAAGGMLLAIGILSALREAQKSGLGQVVDASIADGSLALISQFFGMYDAGLWNLERGTNVLDSGAPYYDTYPCSDGKLIALAAIEDKFFSIFLRLSGLSPDLLAAKRDRQRWPELRRTLADCFATKTRDAWSTIFADADACVSPVLDLSETVAHPHLAERQSFVEVEGRRQPAPVPRFSRTVPAKPQPSGMPNRLASEDVFAWWKRIPTEQTHDTEERT